MPATPPAEAPLISAYGRPRKGKTVTIKCKHHVGPGRKLCGAERTIQVQDVFQVTRCTAHQKIFAAEKRRAREAAKRKAATKSKPEADGSRGKATT
jgi:hypothetical protein